MSVEDAGTPGADAPSEGSHDHLDGATLIEQRGALEHQGSARPDGNGEPLPGGASARKTTETPAATAAGAASLTPGEAPERRPVVVLGTGPMALMIAEIL